MIGLTVKAVVLLIDRWYYRVFMFIVLFYCLWLFCTAVDAHLISQMHFYSQNLGI